MYAGRGEGGVKKRMGSGILFFSPPREDTFERVELRGAFICPIISPSVLEFPRFAAV